MIAEATPFVCSPPVVLIISTLFDSLTLRSGRETNFKIKCLLELLIKYQSLLDDFKLFDISSVVGKIGGVALLKPVLTKPRDVAARKHDKSRVGRQLMPLPKVNEMAFDILIGAPPNYVSFHT